MVFAEFWNLLRPPQANYQDLAMAKKEFDVWLAKRFGKGGQHSSVSALA